MKIVVWVVVFCPDPLLDACAEVRRGHRPDLLHSVLPPRV